MNDGGLPAKPKAAEGGELPVISRRVGPEAAEEVLGLVRAAFAARPVLDPPAPALAETTASVGRALALHGGLVAYRDGVAVGSTILDVHDQWLGLRRVAVSPAEQGRGIAHHLVAAAERLAASSGLRRVELVARAELPDTVGFWVDQGYREIYREGTSLTLAKELPVVIEAFDRAATQALGRRLAQLLQPGDLIIVNGELGAGKTTFTQGVAAGLDVRGAVTSPTFVIARTHAPTRPGSPGLVHVDAYRLGGFDELDDLDLDTSMATSVTIVEWGGDAAQRLAEDRLIIDITADYTSDQRTLRFVPIGSRWVGSDIALLVAGSTEGHLHG